MLLVYYTPQTITPGYLKADVGLYLIGPTPLNYLEVVHTRDPNITGVAVDCVLPYTSKRPAVAVPAFAVDVLLSFGHVGLVQLCG